MINRFVNNSFTPFYEPTLSYQTFRRAVNVNIDDPSTDPKFVDLEIWDMFPHDHPLLNEESELMQTEAKAMEEKLDEVIKSPYGTKDLINRIHAYVFVFDNSNRKTFQNMKCMIETVVELEKTKRKGDSAKQSKGSKKGSVEQSFYPKKLVIGNKKDLHPKNKQDEITLKDMQEIGKLGINCKFVSALNNQEITTAFMKLV